jgi:hypothetical protein
MLLAAGQADAAPLAVYAGVLWRVLMSGGAMRALAPVGTRRCAGLFNVLLNPVVVSARTALSLAVRVHVGVLRRERVPLATGVLLARGPLGQLTGAYFGTMFGRTVGRSDPCMLLRRELDALAVTGPALALRGPSRQGL